MQGTNFIDSTEAEMFTQTTNKVETNCSTESTSFWGFVLCFIGPE